MTKRTGGRILVDQLVAQGCERIFTVPGESFLAVLDALHDTPAIEVVTCRQEGGAAFMACADGTLTHRPGVAFVTRGPGATNASIGVHVAQQDSQPMILFIGDVDRGTRDREAFQEIDFAAMFSPVAKWAARIDDARRIPEYVARAYATATNGRPGPVVLALPEDMLLDREEAVDRPRTDRIAQACGVDDIARLTAMLARAERPVAIVGGAGWDEAAARDFGAWATRSGVPVVAAFRRQDALPNDCPVWAGNLGYGPNPRIVERVRTADLLIVAGPRLGEATTDGYALVTPDHPDQLLVQVHPDPDELGRAYRADLAVCAGMAEFAAALGEVNVPQRSEGGDAHRDFLAWSTPKPRPDVALDLGPCVAAMRERLPADSIICNGAGNYSGWWHRYWRYAGPGTQLAPTAGAMGYGLPAAIAASLREPERSVVALAGDGCFLMNGQELATAVQHGCSILVIVVDNGAYGTIRMHQEREFPGRVEATTLGSPDFAALARAYGCWAETVERTEDFAPALERAMAAPGVRLLHLRTDVEQITAGTTLSAIRGRLSVARLFVPILAGARWRDRVIASLGALLAIAIAAFAGAHAVVGPAGLPPIVASLGASAVLVFAVPASPLAQPWPVVGGNTLSALVGVLVAIAVPQPALAAGVAVGAAILVMSLARCLHPPGAAALTAVIGGKAVAAAGLAFPLVVAADSVALVALGWLLHRVSGHSYPHRPAAPVPVDLLHREDIDRALADLGEAFDIARDDLDVLMQRAEAYAVARRG